MIFLSSFRSWRYLSPVFKTLHQDKHSSLTEYIQTQLDRSTHFLKSLAFQPGINYPSFSVISGSIWPTPTKFLTMMKDGKFQLLFPILERGDGVVPEASTAMPDGYSYKRLRSSAHHAFLLNDFDVMESALRGAGENVCS